MKSKSFFALLLALSLFFGQMVFAEDTSPSSSEGYSSDIIEIVPYYDIFALFTEQEQTLDAVSASMSRFDMMAQKLRDSQKVTTRYQEQKQSLLSEIHTLQKKISQDIATTRESIEAMDADLESLTREQSDVQKKYNEIVVIIKKMYLQSYEKSLQSDTDVTLVGLLLDTSFGRSIQESQSQEVIQATALSLMLQQKQYAEKLTLLQETLTKKQQQRTRALINLERYESEIADMADLEAQILEKTVAKNGAIRANLVRNTVTKRTLSDTFEATFVAYEANILEYSKKFDCDRTVSDACTWISNYIQAEKKLRTDTSSASSDVWPIKPKSGFGFHFRDQKYHNIHSQHHTGLDVLVKSGTPVAALNDGYIIARTNATKNKPGIVIMKHKNGILAVYRNVVASDLPLFSMIRQGEPIGKVGTLVEHSDTVSLHIELYRAGKIFDPLERLSLGDVAPKYIPARYGWKYIDDLKKLKKDYDIASLQKLIGFFYIAGDDEISRQTTFLQTYASASFSDPALWIEESMAEGVDPTFVMCVGFAESTLGNNLTTDGNIGNVGNTDSGDRRAFSGPRAGVRAIASTVNNQWLGHYETIDQLSGWGNTRGPIYASSPTNWHENIVKCMSALKGRYVGNSTTYHMTESDRLRYQKAGYALTE